MHIVYTTEEAPNTYHRSIFLAGPSPREKDHPNWREEALRLLDEMGYDGVVYVPLPRNGDWPSNYDGVRSWERKNLDRADAIVFWVPRDMKVLPALTTNIEWGVWYDSGRAVLGYPLDAPHMRYLGEDAKEEGVAVAHTLKETLSNAIKQAGRGAVRMGGERDVPLNIWEKPDFQQWYRTQIRAGNQLVSAKPVWTFRVGPMKSKVFLYALHVNVWIRDEDRNKTNEIVIFRPDISVIIGYEKPEPGKVPDLKSTKVVLIREFRSPANTSDGKIHEFPGGSSPKPGESAEEIAAHEFEEETGFKIAPERFGAIGARQLAGTLSAHKAHVFVVGLTPDEMTWFIQEAVKGTPRGVESDTERTYIEVQTVGRMLENPNVDWSMMGMVLTALNR